MPTKRLNFTVSGQQSVFPKQSVNTFFVNKQPLDKNHIRPDSAVTPKWIALLDHWQNCSVGSSIASSDDDRTLPIVFFKIHRQFADHRFQFLIFMLQNGFLFRLRFGFEDLRNVFQKLFALFVALHLMNLILIANFRYGTTF